MSSHEKEELLAKILSLVRKKPGIRPSEINKILNLEHSWPLRLILVKKGLVKKKKDGIAVRYYPAK